MEANIFDHIENSIEEQFERRRAILEERDPAEASTWKCKSTPVCRKRRKNSKDETYLEKYLKSGEISDKLPQRTVLISVAQTKSPVKTPLLPITAEEKSLLPSNPSSHTYNKVTISRRRIYELRQIDGWVDNDFMDLFVMRLRERNHQRVKTMQRGHPVVVLDSFFVNRLEHANHTENKGEVFESLIRWFENVSWTYKETKLILCPFRAEKHWFLLSVHVESNLLTIYDSFPRITEIGSKAAAVMKLFLSFYEEKIKVQKTEWVTLEKAAYPKQTDGGSCGIFVAWVMEYLERGAVPSFEQNDIEVLRTRAEMLIRGHTVVPIESFTYPKGITVKQEICTEDIETDKKTEMSQKSTEQKEVESYNKDEPKQDAEKEGSFDNQDQSLVVVTKNGDLDHSSPLEGLIIRSPSKRMRRPPARFRSQGYEEI